MDIKNLSFVHEVDTPIESPEEGDLKSFAGLKEACIVNSRDFLGFPNLPERKSPKTPTQGVRYLPNTGAGAGVAVHVPPVSRSSMEVP